jgi:hypothetical protein
VCRRHATPRASKCDKQVAAHGSPVSLLRKRSRDEPKAAIGSKKLAALKLAADTVITRSRGILDWIDGEE